MIAMILILTHAAALGLGILLFRGADTMTYREAARNARQGWDQSALIRKRAQVARDRAEQEVARLRQENKVLRSVITDATQRNGVYR